MSTHRIVILLLCLATANVGTSNALAEDKTHRLPKTQAAPSLSEVIAEPAPVAATSPVATEATPDEVANAGDKCPEATSDNSCSSQCCTPCKPASPCRDWWHSPCNMVQHLAYPPEAHGWYYFRPYNFGQLRDLQEATSSWGGDPRNPYADDIFRQVYSQSASKPIAQRK